MSSSGLLLAAIIDGAVVGQLQAMIEHHLDGPPQLYIDNLGVSPLHQRRGIARGLIQEVSLWANELGCHEAWIVTDLDNHEANALYRSVGAKRSTVALHSLDHLSLPPSESSDRRSSLRLAVEHGSTILAAGDEVTGTSTPTEVRPRDG